MAVLVDTGILVADADRRDKAHQRVRAFLESVREALLVPITVVPEASYLLYRRLGPHAEALLVAALGRGEIEVEPVTPADLGRAAVIMERYSDLPLGCVDATIVAVAERLGIARIATLDHRHFTVVRPQHVSAFDLLP